MKITLHLNKELSERYKSIVDEISRETGTPIAIGNVVRAVLRLGKGIPADKIKEEVMREPIYPSRKGRK